MPLSHSLACSEAGIQTMAPEAQPSFESLTSTHSSAVTTLSVYIPAGASGKEPTCQCGRCRKHGFDSWVRSSVRGLGSPLQYSCLENPMDRGAWQATVHGVSRVGHDLVSKPPPPPPQITESRNNRVPHPLLGSLKGSL